MLDEIDFSVVTVSYNAENTIRDTINSVLSQKDVNLEYIVIDGCSIDKTVNILNEIKDPRFSFVSEKDKGLYDAMNKGIKKATGKYVAIINSDDLYVDEWVLSRIFSEFEKTKSDIISGNIYYFDDFNVFKKKRLYSAPCFKKKKAWKKGAQPPHPSTFVRKTVYDEIGLYNIDFKIASDYDFLFRAMYVHDFVYSTVDHEVVAMRLGGESTSGLKSVYLGNKEVLSSWKLNGKKAPLSLIPKKLFRKYINR
ncbi:glycosyltransferase family 2 protein [Vibrio splendidus]